MRVAVELPIGSPYIEITFQVNDREFMDWYHGRYGIAGITQLNSIDPVGELLHLLREFHLSESEDGSIQNVQVEVINNNVPLLPCGE